MKIFWLRISFAVMQNPIGDAAKDIIYFERFVNIGVEKAIEYPILKLFSKTIPRLTVVEKND